jgi:hypothetical protein
MDGLVLSLGVIWGMVFYEGELVGVGLNSK